MILRDLRTDVSYFFFDDEIEEVAAAPAAHPEDVGIHKYQIPQIGLVYDTLEDGKQIVYDKDDINRAWRLRWGEGGNIVSGDLLSEAQKRINPSRYSGD